MLSRRVQEFTESVIREMTRVAHEHGGVNLAQGFPNFSPPAAIVEAAHRALDGDFNQYSITWGAKSLRQAVAEKYRRFYGMDVEADRNVTIGCGAPHPLQEAAVTALALPDSYYTDLREKYETKRDVLLGSLEKAGFIAVKPRGAYYILTDVAHFMKRYGIDDDMAFAMFLVKEIGVATVPGSSFYSHKELGRTKIRFCFPKTDDVLREAGERLQKLA